MFVKIVAYFLEKELEGNNYMSALKMAHVTMGIKTEDLKAVIVL